jgi:hypothetical protein
VTLGSLYEESLAKLEELGILPDGSSDEESTRYVEQEQEQGQDTAVANRPPHRMTNRGIPYFEELVEHSRFGRIRRQVGGHTSQDGTTSVRWEITEMDNATEDDQDMPDVRESAAKRQRVNS